MMLNIVRNRFHQYNYLVLFYYASLEYGAVLLPHHQKNITGNKNKKTMRRIRHLAYEEQAELLDLKMTSAVLYKFMLW